MAQRAAVLTRHTGLSLSISDKVKSALRNGQPVVALESTIITHGMPFPANLECAISVESQVEQFGAVAATICIMDGVVKVGLTDGELQVLAQHSDVVKCSKRDLPYVLARRGWGGTTVAATMFIAHLAGIEVFVTGGCGGVHQGYSQTLDLSADLYQLKDTPCLVVSAGIKSILDIPKSLEMLESLGVPVYTLGSTSFPAFYTPDSGYKTLTLSDPREAARVWELTKKVGGGMFVAVPPPPSSHTSLIEQSIATALEESKELRGKEVTPFLLDRVNILSRGESLKANIALVLNNARVGAQIAVALARV